MDGSPCRYQMYIHHRAVTEEKTLLYFMNHKPFSPKPQWKSLVPLDIKEQVWIFVSIGMQKDSELFELFNHNILKMLETGVVERMRKKWLVIPGKYKSYFNLVEPLKISSFDTRHMQNKVHQIIKLRWGNQMFQQMRNSEATPRPFPSTLRTSSSPSPASPTDWSAPSSAPSSRRSSRRRGRLRWASWRREWAR